MIRQNWNAAKYRSAWEAGEIGAGKYICESGTRASVKPLKKLINPKNRLLGK
jgi:hypothetical protein